MSETEVYLVGKNHYECIGTSRNSHRSFMYVWDYIAKKYHGLDSFPSWDDNMRKKVWNSHLTHFLEEYETIVLLSTMDYALISVKDYPKLREAYLKFWENNKDSAYLDIVELIDRAYLDIVELIDNRQSLNEDDIFICMNTSLGTCLFEPDFPDEEHADTIFADLSFGFNIFEELDIVKNYKAEQSASSK